MTIPGLVRFCVAEVQIDRYGVSWEPAQLSAAANAIFLIPLAAVPSVVDVAVTMYRPGRKAGIQGALYQRHVHGAFKIFSSEVAYTGFEFALPLIHRPVSGVDDGTAGSVFSEQGTLRATHNLNAGEIYVVQDTTLHARKVRPVDVDADSRVVIDAGIAGTDTANIDLRLCISGHV